MRPDSGLRTARWFSIEATPDWAQWVVSKEVGSGSWHSCVELLGTIISLMVFCPAGKRSVILGGCITGGTDNLCNACAVAKLSSTKWPLTIGCLNYQSR